jgi:RES domain-containing protein
MLPEAELKVALGQITPITLHGPFSRCVAFQHLVSKSGPASPAGKPKPLWGLGSATSGARFTPRGGFESVYLAEDPITALAEVAGVFMHPQVPAVALQTQPWVIMSIRGILVSVLDLTNSDVMARLGSNRQELTGAWRLAEAETGNAPTQMLGRACYESGRFDAIRYFSSKNSPTGVCVAVFSDRLTGAAFIEVYDPNGNLVQRIH